MMIMMISDSEKFHYFILFIWVFLSFQVYLIFLLAVTRCRCDHTAYSSTIGNGQFGELLKPPPPPQILPVPFHGGAGRSQRQNANIGYQYQPPPPPPPTQITQIPFPPDFKFPAPFYKQYNFNFVPPPQPFITTPSPSLFQKVSTWLFPSQQISYDAGLDSNNLGPIKKDCNPCNLVPWIPVIRYNLGAKSNQVYHSNNPTYGPPSPTALADNAVKFQPQTFLHENVDKKPLQLSPGIPHAVYGPPKSTFNSYSNSGVAISSTYGPPSPTHTIPSQNPASSTYIAPSSPYSVPSSTYGVPSSSIGQPSSSYLPSYTQGVSITSYNTPTSTYRPPSSLYTTPAASYQSPFPVTTYGPPVTPYYEPESLNNDLPQQNDIEVLNETGPSGEQQLPKVAHPTGFRNSYGELITNPYILDSPYPVSATAAESTKVKTQVLPNDFSRPPNQSLSLANPAPFTLNRGRNIHTLQPVALPNLSVSPLPPIFNARPFRPLASPFPSDVLQGINQMQQKPNNVDVAQSIPLAEYTHSVDYPTTFVQSPVIDIDSLRINNQTKTYRNIPNHFVIDEIRDISSQASEDHVQATKTVPEASFESTGTDVGNDIYDIGLPADFNQNSYVPQKHKPNHKFGDLRGYKDEDVDKYRTESNLQNIDSPLLYLKPSAPHKSFGNFVFAVSTPVNDNEFEIYDDVLPTTQSPQPPTITAWDESRNEFSESLSPPPIQSNTYQPKIVQIIVPYTTGKKENKNADYEHISQQWADIPHEKHQARKIPSHTDSPNLAFTENYSIIPTPTEEPLPSVTDNYDERLTSAAVLNDLYDVKEPPFDIVKLQHNIDDWTEQEYSRYKPPQRNRNSEKYAKKIPDEYFMTTIPTNLVTETDSYYDLYDHEGSSSNHHSVTDKSDEEHIPPRKEYNTIEITKSRYNSGKNEEQEEIQKLHIYTAASSFRTTTTRVSTTTTTPAPWGKIQTSISPLTKEKVYVVTSKPWRDTQNATKDWYGVESFESKKTNVDADTSASDVSFKSPRFMHRPSFGFTSGGKVESAKTDSSYGFSRSWYQSSKFY